ncbi:M1 family metallopeptidase [Leuconostoc holzapfelii]|uniref:Aminopeptidase n=1 Tax=Leuconostoc holzapfelii TaxID=434464 RepID=A0A846ZD08_9LACO|nr:M1 family metallopeptidase [Leuconostoc holzapfelii]NKZ18828.1 M1 family metallopeptidase [Leuconostoc holzapfelii]
MTEPLQHFLTTFVPKHYDVYLDINRQAQTIVGEVTIFGEALSDHIFLHQRGLKIKSVTVNQNEVAFTTQNTHEALGLANVPLGQVEIVICYETVLTATLMGIYPSDYEVNGVKKQLVLTQFESSGAREAFPSIDEPAAKATFDLAIKYDEQPNETILANMPETQVVDQVHYFATTLRMSTYLVAFAFGSLISEETTTSSGVKIQVFATDAHTKPTLRFALDMAKRSIAFYEAYFQTPYPLPESKQLAVPDLSFGAMENWGLVTYRESALLIDPENAALTQKHRVATIIAHELAHQWFGDLVTMAWWDDLWLNESFANMMEYVAIDALMPEWHIWESFQMNDVPLALQRDAIDGVQPVHVAINHPDEVNTFFDSAIVYAKGARMLVMTRAMIGDAAFQKGLKHYFDAHQYGNATGADLWRALSNASGQDVTGVMATYLTQPGYPVISVTVNPEGQLIISQQQFFIGPHDDQERLWQVPLTSNFSDQTLLLKTKAEIIGDYASLRKQVGGPILLNIGQQTHAIIHYDDALLADILVHLDQFNAVSQLQILHDLRLLVQAQIVSYAQILPVLHKVAANPTILVQQASHELLNDMQRVMQDDATGTATLQLFVRQLVQPQLQRLGWEARPNEANDDTRVRPLIIGAALTVQLPEACAKSDALYGQYQADLTQMPAYLRRAVLRDQIARTSNIAWFKQLFIRYQQTSDTGLRQDLMATLPGTTNQAALQLIVAHLNNIDVVKPQDFGIWYGGLLHNPAAQQAAWDWARAHWDWLDDKLNGSMNYTNLAKIPANYFQTPQRLAEFKAFFGPKLNQANLTREIIMGQVVIENQIALIKAQHNLLGQALEAALY